MIALFLLFKIQKPLKANFKQSNFKSRISNLKSQIFKSYFGYSTRT
jgi:hypothetical protein